ncbi:MAG: hypothetical protein JW735_08440 [Prolixibacteraceae bacterium]|nr:hypothetical protein [Prolixibacteraceae bacterium]
MRFLEERFGIQRIRLNSSEESLLISSLREIDFKRISFVALISIAYCLVFIIIDLSSVYNELTYQYLILDAVFFVLSLLVVLSYAYSQNKLGLRNQKLIAIVVKNYPFVLLAWATAIAALDSDSILNLATYYFVLFLIAFMIYAPYWLFSTNFFVVVITYVLVVKFNGWPILSASFAFILTGIILSIVFFGLFSTTRYNAQAALIKLNKANKNLEIKVEERTKELRNSNENLENEIAHRIVIEKQLKSTLKKAEAVNKLKSEFLANISHEVRTPLNAIIGFTEMMTEDGVNEQQKKEFQKLVSSNTLYLLSTFDDIFDASYVRDEKFKAVNKPMKVNQFVDVLAYETNGIALKHDKYNLEIKFAKIDDNKLEISTDEFFLKKAIMRLVDNAYKFTHQGSIEIGARYVNRKIEYFVKDTGIGIDKKDFKKIFQPFVQGDGSFSRGYGGSGLGLTIVKGIVEALKCGFEIETEQGKGTCFRLIFDNHFILKNA